MIGTLYGTGGPFYVLYLKFRKIEKTQFRATFATIFLLDGAERIAGYVFTGFFSLDLVLIIAAAIPLMVINSERLSTVKTTFDLPLRVEARKYGSTKALNQSKKMSRTSLQY
jgi:hypothetical protein